MKAPVLVVQICVCFVSLHAWPCNICHQGKDEDCSNIKEGGTENARNIMQWAKLPLSSAAIESTVERSGFHSIVTTVVNVTASKAEEIARRCVILYVQTVPNSFFIDQYEVRRRRYDFIELFNENIDVELPQYLANESVVMFFSALHHHKENVLTSKLSVPWHSRYHECSSVDELNTTHVSKKIPPPKIMTSCLINSDRLLKPLIYHSSMKNEICSHLSNAVLAPCAQNQQHTVTIQDATCVWTNMVNSNSTGAEIGIPIGTFTHSLIVKIVTLVVTWCGTFIIGWCSFKHAVRV